MSERKLALFIAASLDGYIAKTGDDLSFLSLVEKEGEDYGYSKFISTVDTVILGRRTYEWVLKHAPAFAHQDKEVFVITSKQREAEGNIQFYSGNLKDLIVSLKKRDGKTIFCDGGAQVVNQLLKDSLIDEFTISIIPVLLGDGIQLFSDGRPETKLKLMSAKAYDTGLVQLHYVRKG